MTLLKSAQLLLGASGTTSTLALMADYNLTPVKLQLNLLIICGSPPLPIVF